MKRAVIYARVSTQKQASDGVSMDSQIEQCRLKALALQAQVVQVFRDDGVSGRTDKRPGYQSALAYCAANKVNYFICWSTSRFGRNLEDALKNVSVLREWGTKPAYVHQDIDLDTDSGWMLGVMTSMMDEVYSRNVSRDTLRSMISASRDGYWVGGRTPFGYQAVSEGKRSRLVPHEVNAGIVRMMFRVALDEGLGAIAIAKKFNSLGITRDGKNWGSTSVAAILKNTSYMGLRTYNRVKHKTRERKLDSEVVQVASHPSLVSKEDFEEVQQMMNQRIPHEKGGTPRSTFSFTGLLKCCVCGRQLQIRNGTGRKGVVYNYYACLGHKTGAPRCLMKAIPAESFDRWMLDELLDRVLTASVVQGVIDEVKSTGGKWVQERELRRKELNKVLRDKEKRRSNLFDVLELHGRDAPSLADLTRRLHELNQELETVAHDMRVLESQTPPDYSDVHLDADEATESIRTAIRACEDQRQLRALLGTFVAQITVSSLEAVVEYREEALLRAPAPTVHSGLKWLLNLGSNQGPTD